MAIQFSIARRGLLPHEKEQQGVNQQADLKNLRVVPVCTETVDAVEFQSSSSRLPTVLPKSELLAALDTIQRVMIHELEQGNAVTLPGIGTFRVTVKGDIEVKDGSYHGKNVRVDGLNFRPDRELLKKAQGFEVSQVPLGQTIQTEGTDVEARLIELFASKVKLVHPLNRYLITLSSHFSVIALWRSCTINIWQCRALNVHIHCLSIVPICND